MQTRELKPAVPGWSLRAAREQTDGPRWRTAAPLPGQTEPGVSCLLWWPLQRTARSSYGRMGLNLLIIIFIF